MLIGLVGFAGSGKGTVGDILIRNNVFMKMSFADAVKDSVSVVFSWDRKLLEGDTDESRIFRETKDEWWSEKFGYDVTPRLMMQLMGTEAGRNVFHKDIWVHTVLRRLAEQENVVIPDVRFPNEMEAVRNNGGFIVRVVRGKDPEWYGLAERANREGNTDLMCEHCVHYSEWAWIGRSCDYVIHNNGAPSMLEADVSHMLKVFTGPIKSDIVMSSVSKAT